MDDEFFDRLRGRVLVYFEGTNPCHDISHVDRVLKLALRLGESEGADLEIVWAAALLHDVARKEQDELGGMVCHAERGGELARDILKEMGISEESIKKVVHCVETHRFRKENIPESVEAMVLYDADKLDAIGAIGILRAGSFSGSIGANVHDTSIDIENTEAYGKDDSAYREFLVKLVKVKDKMLTVSGREIAVGRHDFMVEFFDRLNKEVEGEL